MPVVSVPALALFRHAPAKKAIGAGFAVSTAGMVALTRWAVSTWGPGVQQVVLSRVGVWYVILTGAAGVAVTYWLDDPANEKVNTTIRVGLQGLSMAVVYACVADERAAVAAVLLLMVHNYLLAILRCVPPLRQADAGVCQTLHMVLKCCRLHQACQDVERL